MKKILFLLLSTVSIYGQTLQNPTYGVVTEKNNASDSTPAYFVTSQTDGVHKKTPAALIALKADLPTTYTTVVYVNSTDPNSATIFDDVNPPVTNDPLLDNDTANLYIGTDASTWVYNGSIYITKTVPATSPFKLLSGINAGGNTTSSIYREGSFSSNAFVSSNAGIFVNRDGSNTAQNGGFFSFSNSTSSNSMMFQLNASNGLDLWNYSSSTWNKRFAFSSGGDLTANSFIKSGATVGNILLAGGSDIPQSTFQTALTNPITGTPTNEYIPKATTGGILTNSLIYDTSTSIGIGTTSPFRKLSIEHTGSTYLGINDTTNNKYSIGSDSNGLIFFDDTHGRYMAKFDKITGAFSVDGNISATSYTGSATLTGTPTAPTAPVGTNTTQIATTAFVQAAATSNIAQTITNGVTTSAPSQDAVFDALAKKANSSGGTFSGNVTLGGGNIYTCTGGTGLLGCNGNISFTMNYPSVGWMSNTNIKATFFKTSVYTVATLPTENVSTGSFATVSDALAPTYMTTVVGGGTVVTPVFYNGTSWVAH